MDVVSYMCVSCKFMIVAMQRSKAKQKFVKGQLTLFDERASSDTDNLGKELMASSVNIVAVMMTQEHKVVSDTFMVNWWCRLNSRAEIVVQAMQVVVQHHH